MSVEEIADNIFANVEYDGGNAACINTSDGVVLVDTPMLPKHISEMSSIGFWNIFKVFGI